MSSSPTRRPCLLIVDDTPANIQIMVGLLQADYELKVATRGAQALQICEKTPHLDLILLDVMMPEMDGYEVCRQLRAGESTRDIPIIFLTAKTDVEDVVRGFELGANDYVTKPCRPAELLARVRTHLLVRQQQREIAEKNTELKEVLQIVAHDVANHFAVVNMSIELMQRTPSVPLERTLSRIAAAGRNGAALTTLVRDLRRAEDKGLLVQSVSLSDSVNEALLLAETRLNDKQLTVNHVVPDLQVVAEVTSLTNSVLGNIISNAIKFSHPGSEIDISAHVEDGRVCLRVRDHGIGMPPDMQKCLFDVTKSCSRRGTAGESGTGFGMPVMHKFVTLFGGTVHVVSREKHTHPHDHGTEFIISLTLADGSG